MSDGAKHANMPNVNLEESDGVIVRAIDGRVFYLPKADVAKTQLHGEKLARAEELLAKGGFTPPPQPDAFDNCKNLLRWLLSNDPGTENWRAVSAWWIDEC
jgi:hypothetical protein